MRLALLVTLLSTTAAAAGPREIADLLDRWRIEDAERAIAPLRASSPADPELLLVDGRLRFEQGRYGEALRLIERGLAAGRASAEGRALRELVSATEAATRGFVEARSPEGHFIVRHAPGRDDLLVPYAFEALEAARREIAARDFDATASLGEPVRVEIYPEIASLAQVSTLTLKEIETSGTIALCKFNRLMIVSPRALAHGYPWLDTLAHEYTHMVVSRVSHNRVPIWLHEGLARYSERRWRQGKAELTPTMEHLLATALGRGRRLITFAEMSPSMAKLPSQADTALAFAEVFTAVELIVERRGWDGVRQLIAALRDGRTESQALAQVVGGGFEDLQRQWREWLQGRKLRARPGLVPPSLRFVRAPAGKGERQDDDSGDVAEERARRLVRLGGLLRARHRLAAAAVEYEKARAIVGPEHLAVARRLARTCLELGDLDRAIAVGAPAIDLYPEAGGLAATVGEAWLRKGDGARAAGYLEAAIRANPFDPGPHCGLARIESVAPARREREQAACRRLEGDE